MKVVIWNHNPRGSDVTPGYIYDHPFLQEGFLVTSDISRARVFSSPDTALNAIQRRNERYSLKYGPREYSLVPVEVTPPPPPTPTVRRLI